MHNNILKNFLFTFYNIFTYEKKMYLKYSASFWICFWISAIIQAKASITIIVLPLLFLQ